jgi:hypothetical protein
MKQKLSCIFLLASSVAATDPAIAQTSTTAQVAEPRVVPRDPRDPRDPRARPRRLPRDARLPRPVPSAPINPYPPLFAPPPGTPPLVAPLPGTPPVAPVVPRARNQNPSGQPAALPPHLRQRDDLGGVKNWYASTGAGFGYDEISRSNPGVSECNENCQKTITEPRWAMQLYGAAGWGPIKRNNISFTTHYRYSQNLRTNDDQLERFKKWFSTFKAEDFIFPTRDMLRSHELVAEIRYSNSPFQMGIHSMLNFERVGSSANFLGAPNEVADSFRNIEQVVPWVQWRIPGTYIATLYSPMRTEINKEDPRNSFTTWSFQRAGRGIFLSAIQDNLIYFPKIFSTANVTLSWTNKKSASIQNDSSKLGVKTVMDFPIVWNIRMQPFFRYESEKFILPRIQINNQTDGSATLEKRTDSILGTGGQVYFDLNKNWRFSFALNFESNNSTLSNFAGSKMSYFGGLSYSWPLTRPVLRRLDRFSDSLSAEEN